MDGRHTFDDMINTWIELSETYRVDFPPRGRGGREGGEGGGGKVA